jgi:hypothetical protein
MYTLYLFQKEKIHKKNSSTQLEFEFRLQHKQIGVGYSTYGHFNPVRILILIGQKGVIGIKHVAPK